MEVKHEGEVLGMEGELILINAGSAVSSKRGWENYPGARESPESRSVCIMTGIKMKEVVRGGSQAVVVIDSKAGEVPYTVLRDGIYTHPTMSGAFNDLFGV